MQTGLLQFIQLWISDHKPMVKLKFSSEVQPELGKCLKSLVFNENISQ